MEKKYLLAVYDNLVDGKNRHHILNDSKYIGCFISNPDFYMFYDINSKNIVIIDDGDNCIYFEIYEVSERIMKTLEFIYKSCEQFIEQKYILTKIETPFGDANTFIFKDYVNFANLIESGDVNSKEVEKFYIKQKYGQE